MEVWGIFIVCGMLGSIGCCAACKLYGDLHRQDRTVHVLHI